MHLLKRFTSFVAGLFRAGAPAVTPTALSASPSASLSLGQLPPYRWPAFGGGHARPDARGFGLSRECRRMGRARRLRAAGLGGDKI